MHAPLADLRKMDTERNERPCGVATEISRQGFLDAGFPCRSGSGKYRAGHLLLAPIFMKPVAARVGS